MEDDTHSIAVRISGISTREQQVDLNASESIKQIFLLTALHNNHCNNINSNSTV